MFFGVLQSILKVFSRTWWIVIPAILFFILWDIWLFYLKIKYVKSIKWTTLHFRIPKEILKTPKAMEQIFAAVHAIWDPPDFWEKYFKGKYQDWVSFEIIGQEKGVHFYCRLPSKYRNLIESAVYGQYPEAEINEVEDYIELLPVNLPNQTYDLFGTELCLIKDDAYPIRTYPYFEELVEEKRLDPLSAITETMSKLKEGEKIFLQILVKPTGGDWVKKAEKVIDKLIGKKPVSKKGFFGGIEEFLRNLFFAPIEYPVWSESGGDKESDPNLLRFLTPGAKDVVKAIEDKISKLGFETAIRFIYIDKAVAFSRGNVSAVLGAFRQFNTLNLNGFKPRKKTMTKAKGLFKKYRAATKKKFLYYVYRERLMPKKVNVLNTEELATIYHFPTKMVEAPMVHRIEAKKGEPPAGLPTE